MDLGSRISHWRRWRGWTQRQLADAVGVCFSSVCQWEGAGKFRNTPTTTHVAAVAAALGLSMSKFYGPLPKIKPAKKAA